jgi:hypothetical protein
MRTGKAGGIGHEQLPQKSGPVILDHDHDRSLIDCKILPVMGLAEGIGETKAAPNSIPQHIVKMAKGAHRLLRRIGKLDSAAVGAMAPLSLSGACAR